MSDTPNLVRGAFCGFDVGGGYIAEFQKRLNDAEKSLEQKLKLKDRELGKYLGIVNIGGFRPNAARHGLGRAIDVNYSGAPYIATRTPKAGGYTYGGEAQGANLQGIREAAMAACDRAVDHHYGSGTADLAARRPGESTASVWNRFKHVDLAWRAYFGVVFVDSPKVQRAPGVPPLPAELVPVNAGSTVGVSAELRTQIIADFDAVRIPTVFGTPSAKPAKTRNPVRGFLPFGSELAIALCDVGGCRWGACDFGARESGDIMHFDR